MTMVNAIACEVDSLVTGVLVCVVCALLVGTFVIGYNAGENRLERQALSYGYAQLDSGKFTWIHPSGLEDTP